MDWQPERYRDRLKLMARSICLDRRLKRFFDSSDLVQITLEKATKKKSACRATDEGGRLCWLHEILKNVFRDERDKLVAGKRNLNLEVPLMNPALEESSAALEKFIADKAPSPEQEAARHELLDAVSQAVEQLPEDQREVVIRHYLQGAPMNEIARDLRPGCTPKAAAMLLYRGLRALRERLGTEEVSEP
jgi:RNA polymerase sigma-70 factor (subfamily 1)